jgi:DNA-binding IclR family transcriptional regulator
MAGHSNEEGRSVLSRALAVLESFSNDHPEQSLVMIQQATGLPAATTHRLVTELSEWGALERVGRGRYRIGTRLWQLGSMAPGPRQLRDTALPFLQDLSEVTHHVVHLAILERKRVLYLERLVARPMAPVQSRVARRLPLHATGPGKVMLAHAPPELVDDVIADGLAKWARNTITDPLELRRVLADVRRQGYCLTRDEITDGAASVAAPIRDARGQVVASVSVVVPSDRDLLPLVPPVRMGAAAISRAMRPRTGTS